MTRIACVATIALCWAPFGLIHQGQRMVNDRAPSILLAQECEPRFADWRGCR
jgi:hypothetical protein